MNKEEENTFTKALGEVLGGLSESFSDDNRKTGVYKYLSEEMGDDDLSELLDHLDHFQMQLVSIAMDVLKDKGYKVSKEGYEMLKGLCAIRSQTLKKIEETEGSALSVDKVSSRMGKHFETLVEKK